MHYACEGMPHISAVEHNYFQSNATLTPRNAGVVAQTVHVASWREENRKVVGS